MRISRHIAALLLLVASAVAADNGKHAYLEVRLQNLTGAEIDEAAVVFDQHRCTSGVLGSGAHKTYMGWQKPVGTNALVKWRDGKGVSKEKSVSLVGVYDRSVAGRLTFGIRTTNVTVDFERMKRR
jgi:hypothetical protein